MKRLSKEQILMLHSQLIEQTGGTPGVRDFKYLTGWNYIQQSKQKGHVLAMV